MTRYLGVATDDMSSAALREQLADASLESSGAARVGYDGETVEAALDKAKSFPDYASLRAYSGLASVIHITNPGIEGFFQEVASVSPVDDGGVSIIDASGRLWRRVFTGNIKLEWFAPAANKTVDDLLRFNAAANAARALQNGTNKAPAVEVDAGDYLISAPTVSATWILQAGAEFFDLAGVPPSFVSDTQRLTGKMIALSGIDQYGLIYAGDTNRTVQKLTGRSYSGAVVGASNKSAGGVSGLSYTSARKEYDQGTIGGIFVCVNDETTLSKPGWAVYCEGWRLANVPGNCIVNETQVYNLGNTYVDNPYVYVDDGPTAPGATYGVWLTSGGVPGCNDASFALGIGRVGTTARFEKGIVFKTNSVSSGVAVAAPENYQFAWFKANTQLKDAWISNNIYRQSSTDSACLIQHMRMGASSTANNSLILNRSWSGNVGGVELSLGGERIFQRSAVVNGFAASTWDVGVKTATGVDVRVVLTSVTLRPDADAASATPQDLGETANRFNRGYVKEIRPGSGAPIWTSGAGTPEASVTAPVGSMYTRTDGGAGTTLYIKEAGTGNTGWVAK